MGPVELVVAVAVLEQAVPAIDLDLAFRVGFAVDK